MTTVMDIDAYATLVPEGQYRAAYRGCETGRPFGVSRYFVVFQITELGEHLGLPLLRFYNVPRGPFLPRSHNLWIDYVTLIGRPPPKGRLTPATFLKGCEVLAQVVTVKERIEGRRRIELPEDCWYSKIDRPIRVTAGHPPCWRGRKP